MRNLSKEFTVVLKSGKTVTAEMESEWSYERNYGADADGNRGVGAWFMDDLDFTVPVSYPSWNVDDDGNAMSDEEKLEAVELLTAKAEDDEWEDRFEADDNDQGWE